jgi:integrase
VLDDLGARRVNTITHVDLLDHVERLRKRGYAPNTVRRAFDPVRVVMRRAVQRGWIGANPCTGLELPTGMVRPRDRVLEPSEIAGLLDALTEVRDRALWATAFHAGMRFGELRALRWEHVDLAAGRLHVLEAMDDRQAVIAPKTKAGVRTLPITVHIRKPLLALRAERDGDRAAFVFGEPNGKPFAHTSITRHARVAWLAAELVPVTLHEARHACITIWAQAIANPKRVQALAGHASITMTLDRYGKHMNLGADETAAEVTRFLEKHGG